MNAEQLRVERNSRGEEAWDLWGPYLSERAWGTVREDYSAHGTAWDYFPHDHARSRAFRWSEDGIAGLCDSKQRLCLAFAFWNGRDPILKERLFGLAGPEGNHGEDVKEVYFYDDNTPSHSYMRMTYRYPQSAFPYAELVRQNAARSKARPRIRDRRYRRLRTTASSRLSLSMRNNHAKDILIRARVWNRGLESARLAFPPDALVSEYLELGAR